MSADNYLYVGKLGNGRYGVFDCSASADDPLYRNEPIDVFVTAEAAIKEAHRLYRDGYYEYGVAISEDVMKEWDAA